MIDPFGGSGGFTIGYIKYINNLKSKLNPEKIKEFWKYDNNYKKIFHNDMNRDVVKFAGLEFLCATGKVPD